MRGPCVGQLNWSRLRLRGGESKKVAGVSSSEGFLLALLSFFVTCCCKDDYGDRTEWCWCDAGLVHDCILPYARRPSISFVWQCCWFECSTFAPWTFPPENNSHNLTAPLTGVAWECVGATLYQTSLTLTWSRWHLRGREDLHGSNKSCV